MTNIEKAKIYIEDENNDIYLKNTAKTRLAHVFMNPFISQSKYVVATTRITDIRYGASYFNTIADVLCFLSKHNYQLTV